MPSSDYTHATGRGDGGGEDAIQHSLLKLGRSGCENKVLYSKYDFCFAPEAAREDKGIFRNYGARIYRPSIRENKPETLAFNH